MRFCPFCAHENADDSAQCQKCGKRLPPPRQKPADGERKDSPPPLAAGPKPNVPSRPGGLAPRSPLRARAEAIMSGKAKPGQTGSQPAIPSASATATPAPPPARPASRPPPVPPQQLPLRPPSSPQKEAVQVAPVSNPQSFRHSALPLPPPPNDYKVPMHTPTVLRDATGSAPAIVTPGEDGTGETLMSTTSIVPPMPAAPLQPVSEHAVTTEPHRTLTPVDRARIGAERAWQAARKAIDIDAVKYAIHSTRDRFKKKSEISRIHKDIVTEQQKLDGVLAQLGRQARAADLMVPALSDEMRATKTLEAEGETAKSKISELEQQRNGEVERFRALETEKQTAIAAADQTVLELSEELAAKTSERAGHRAGMNRLDAQLKSLERHAAGKEADLARATIPDQQAVLRGEIEATRAQIAALAPERDRFAQKASDLDAPIAELESKLAAARELASNLRRELGEASRVHQEAVGQIHGQIAAEQQRLSQSERELSLKFVTLGTILNLNRVGGAAFDPHYREFDAIKATIAEREQKIAQLEAEINAVDQKKLQKGWIVIGAAALLLVLVIGLIAH